MTKPYIDLHYKNGKTEMIGLIVRDNTSYVYALTDMTLLNSFEFNKQLYLDPIKVISDHPTKFKIAGKLVFDPVSGTMCYVATDLTQYAKLVDKANKCEILSSKNLNENLIADFLSFENAANVLVQDEVLSHKAKTTDVSLLIQQRDKALDGFLSNQASNHAASLGLVPKNNKKIEATKQPTDPIITTIDVMVVQPTSNTDVAVVKPNTTVLSTKPVAAK